MHSTFLILALLKTHLMSGNNKNLKIITMTSISIILLGSIAIFSEPVYSSHAGGSLVVHYDFEDGNPAPTSDVSGHGNDGTLVGGAGFSADVPPIPGNTKSLDLTPALTGDYLIKNPVAAAPTPFPSTAITVAFWEKSSDSGVPAFVSYAKVAPGTNDVVVQNLFTGVEGCVNNSCTPAGTPNILDGSWHHIAVTWRSSDGQTKVYADGIPTTHTEATGTSIAGAGSLVLGQEQDSVGDTFQLSEAYEGLLDDVRIYNRVLTEAEVKLLATDVTIEKTEEDRQEISGDGDSDIEVGEIWEFTLKITVTNTGPGTLTNVFVKDPLPAEFKVTDTNPTDGVVFVDTKGRTEKPFIEWTIANLPPGMEMLTFVIQTDQNPKGHQEYTSPGFYDLNDGATLTTTIVEVPIKIKSNALPQNQVLP